MTPPGLAVERTVLAWQRTWLTVGACGLLLLRLGSGSPVRVAAILGLGAVVVLAGTYAARRRAQRLRAGLVTPAFRAATWLTATVVLLGPAVAALILAR